MPTAFADMMGRNGIDGHTAFTGLMMNNMFVVIAAIFTPFLIELLGKTGNILLIKTTASTK